MYFLEFFTVFSFLSLFQLVYTVIFIFSIFPPHCGPILKIRIKFKLYLLPLSKKRTVIFTKEKPFFPTLRRKSLPVYF